ncbi:MAG: hypothetical protein V3R87_06895 [Dehalococcoidia bacterium]
MPELIMSISFALSMGVFLLFLGLFLDYLHEKKAENKSPKIPS